MRRRISLSTSSDGQFRPRVPFGAVISREDTVTFLPFPAFAVTVSSMNSRFPMAPLCELCQKNEASAFVHFEDQQHKGWKFCCECAGDIGDYEILFERFFSSPASTVDWMAHMHEKTWMDWADFMGMIDRLRDASKSYGQV
jgi:hypothetical protein